MTIDQLDFFFLDITSTAANNVPLLGKSPPQYHNVGGGIFKESTLMGVFPSNPYPPSTQISTVNMISSTTGDMSKGKEIVETPSLGPQEAL